jgi:glycosyltransferase involved in cell wall biosynthesis
MKILFFIESLGAGGKERRLAELLKRLKNYHDITYEVVLTRRLVHYQEILDLGIKIHYLERKYVKKDPFIFFRFYKLCKDFRPDIIHVWGNMVALYAIPAKLLLRIKLLNNQIGDATIKSKNRLFFAHLAFRFSDAVIANSKAGLESYLLSGKKGMVIYGGFDFKRLENLVDVKVIRNKFNIRTKRIVGMVASLKPIKDYQTYINAANIILKTNKDVTFLCIGYGNDSLYREMVWPENIDHVKFLGLQDNVESIMNCCDIGVLATYTEGISNAIMEFMALGKPVVATDGGGTKEILLDNVTGFLVPPKNPEILSEKIGYLLKNEDISLKMGEAGRDRIKNEFSPQKMVGNFLHIFQYLKK